MIASTRPWLFSSVVEFDIFSGFKNLCFSLKTNLCFKLRENTISNKLLGMFLSSIMCTLAIVRYHVSSKEPVVESTYLLPQLAQLSPKCILLAVTLAVISVRGFRIWHRMWKDEYSNSLFKLLN